MGSIKVSYLNPRPFSNLKFHLHHFMGRASCCIHFEGDFIFKNSVKCVKSFMRIKILYFYLSHILYNHNEPSPWLTKHTHRWCSKHFIGAAGAHSNSWLLWLRSQRVRLFPKSLLIRPQWRSSWCARPLQRDGHVIFINSVFRVHKSSSHWTVQNDKGSNKTEIFGFLAAYRSSIISI